MQVINVNGVLYDSNAYLIDAQRKTLVDAGIDGARVLKKLPADLELIILTHCHFDHIAAVPEIVEKTGAKVAIHEREMPLIRSDRLNCSAMFKSKTPALKIDMVLKTGDVIDLGDYSLEVIHTPGHTPGSICLYSRETKELFTGDTVFESGSFGRTDLGGDSEHMINSLDMLTRLDVETLYPGHGGIVKINARESLLQSYKNARYMLF